MPIPRRTFLRGLLLLGGATLASGLPTSTGAHVQAQAPSDHPVYLPSIQHGRLLQVGPARMYKKPSEARQAAVDGDTIEIDAGLYSGDVATWTQNNLVIRGVGGLAHLEANGNNAGGKAIWVIQGQNTTVENVEFSGASVPDGNGAGIRQEGANLILRGCFFHDNQDGILAGDNPQSEILIEYTEFSHNGAGDGYTHNLYVNHVKKFTLQYCYSHHARVGHLVKSRAYANYILYNRIMDEADGTASYEIDLPDGGESFLIGNLVQQGPQTQNSTIITYAEEHTSNPVQALYAVNNTVVNQRDGGGTFIRAAGSPLSHVMNNLFIGNGTPLSGSLLADHNLSGSASAVVNLAGYDYHLAPGSPAIDAGAAPGSTGGYDLTPGWEYAHPLGRAARTAQNGLDAGAYEYHE